MHCQFYQCNHQYAESVFEHWLTCLCLLQIYRNSSVLEPECIGNLILFLLGASYAILQHIFNLFIEVCSLQRVCSVRALFNCFMITHISVMISSIGPTRDIRKKSFFSWIIALIHTARFLKDGRPNFPFKFSSTSEFCNFIGYSCCMSSLLSFWVTSISGSLSWLTSLQEPTEHAGFAMPLFSYLSTYSFSIFTW